MVPNVGIGTTTPSSKLVVDGSISATGSIGASGAGTGYIELASGAAPAAPPATSANVFVNANGMMQCQFGASASECLPTYNTATNAIGSDVAMTNANTFYDGPAVTLAAGTWMVQGTVSITTSAANSIIPVTCKLWNGTTVTASTETSVNAVAAVRTLSISLQGIVSPVGSTTYKISCASTVASQTISAATTDNGAGNNASTINAFRLK